MKYLEFHVYTNNMKFFGWGLVRKLKLGKYLWYRIFLLKKMPKNSVCAEIGVAEGHFSFKILKYTKPKKLFLIDPWESKEKWNKGNNKNNKVWTKEIQNFRYQQVKKKFENNLNVKIIRDKSENALKSFPDNFFDWVYIDGDHSTKGVLSDLEICFLKVKSGGYIAGDDISFDKDADPTRIAVRKGVELFLNKKPSVNLTLVHNNQFILQVQKK